ncbi:MAG: response regulator [Deltaproteobacteria bacterium]|nr:response regulator [Deltaproteobacteria bacterium]
MPKGNILIIDDEPVILDAASEIFKKADYKVATACNGIEGMEKLAKGSFDLVITDIRMPGMDGLSLIQKIRKEVSTDLPVVVVTGHGTIDTAIESMRHGTQGFLLKPFTPREILDVAEDAVRKSNILKENIKLKAFLPIFDVNKRLLSEVNIDRLLEKAVEEVSRHTIADTSSLMLLGEDGYLEIKASFGMELDLEKPVRVKTGEGIAGIVAEKKEPLLLDQRANDDPVLKHMMTHINIKSALSSPIISRKGGLIGVLNMAKMTDAQPFTNSDMEMASIICGQLGIAIENARLYEGIEKSYIDIIAALASTIEARDSSTAGHAIRMAEYSSLTAIKMGMALNEIVMIRRAALLHDIGKIGIPDNILLKNAPLSEDEYRFMKEHPLIGIAILDNVEGLKDIGNIVKHHHEHFDGSGYPDGLKGDEIPLGARIIAAADAFEAMTTERPYRKAIPVIDAAGELKKMAGTQFDPKVVDVLMQVLTSRGVLRT